MLLDPNKHHQVTIFKYWNQNDNRSLIYASELAKFIGIHTESEFHFVMFKFLFI